MLELFHRWLTLLGISLLLFEDCQSLFLRHTQTGNCVAVSEELVYDDPDHAFPYYVVMTDDCLNDKAQFRFLDTELLQSIEKEGTLVSPKGSTYRSRWSVYKGVSSNGKRYQNDAKHRLKQTAAGSLFFYNKEEDICAESESSSKYLLRKTYCNQTQQEFTFGSVTAFNGKMENVSCSPIQHMVVKSADYGDFDNSGTFNPNANIDRRCSQLTNCQVKYLCGGKRSCKLTMNNNLLPSEYCSDTSKQIYTKYTCVDTYTTTAITAARNIRLTSANKGYIEIKDGSIWRKVVEENWNKKRQKWLCQHLGFEEIDSNVIQIGQLGSGRQIATGDLICYDTQSSGTSCCVHLKPSISTTSTRIPYMSCKICTNPLLHNTTAFPDSVFSGSGDSSNTYKDARITKGGWCPSGSGTAYLTLDLQKEYHITQVVVMADKEQTKWSGLYSLKYSHDTSYENTVQILGNQNGYGASKTSLHIYNVRHVKIQSTGSRNFCLRIELCGEVQRPARVNSIIVSPSPYSARVTWKLPTRRDSSYITKIIVYLNSASNEHQIISRGTQVTIDNLKPNTWYTVGIKTQDSSSQRSRILYNIFTTKKAEPVNLLSTSYYTMSVNIPKAEEYIREVMVIVQIANNSSIPGKNFNTSDLKPYHENIKGPYVTAYLKAAVLPLTFVIGDGKEYNSEEEKYFNQPLQKNTNYIVFLRFFENQHSYYSTEWSGIVKTMEQTPVKYDDNIPTSKKFRIELLIPLVILVICFVVLLGVIIYQRRLIQNKNTQLQRYREERVDIIDSPSVSSKKPTNGVEAAPERWRLKDDQPYESVEFVKNESSSPYMDLKNLREPDNDYQPLQHPGKRADSG